MRPNPKAALVILLMSVLSLFANAAKVLDGTAAIVGKNIITVQDAYFFRALAKFRESSGDPLELEDGNALHRTVQRMIFEEMVFLEQKGFQFEGPKVNEAEKLLKGKWGKPREQLFKKILSTFARTEAMAIEQVHKSLLVERFIQKKVETLTPIITDAEVERYYQQNQTKFQGSDFATLKPNIILLLRKSRTQKGLEEWVKGLKEKFAVTNQLELPSSK